MATVNMISVSKIYDKTVILNDINLNIEKGEFVAVVGSSGSGKSTLLRMVAGLEQVSSGRILINDECVNQIPASRRNMAMVFQNYALYPHMTVFANMAYGLKMRGMSRHLIRQRVEEAGKLLQLSDYLNRKPASLSGGQRQRVAMGRAMVRSPAVFLFDEPLSNLDAKLRMEMRHEIKKLHQKLQTTCLYVTHDQTEAMTLADRIVVLNKGNIEQVGTPQELYQSPKTMFVAGLIGHYPMNFIPATVDLHHKRLATSVGISLPLPRMNQPVLSGENVIIGIRPEHITPASSEDKNCLSSQIELIDDMGADKLVQVFTEPGNLKLSVRLFENSLSFKQKLSLKIDLQKAVLFHKISGNQLGAWHD
ncbi:ABC transporter ATP-binding protein [Legionella londiniensis]|uniref:sn-glycerol-3-phosphate import ATP-binding protein UgpC n=1 Tax=Legionella londiniensis TaxID=45068 RepID=A0A0W0VND2_9GAMM|nr:sn-glycerol-3-phosphate ABC transporter ATP-binding protein UgpC [Legionella londiniensis]KTD21633.1 sn-glycerol-3-phosphate import ATP-binding protein UgpC [Legionella londiniensis]STX93404.1 glycerol-3-phosphate transporter subunit; ATP-binding component of ABC superfamily [Legionella londiniensis]